MSAMYTDAFWLFKISSNTIQTNHVHGPSFVVVIVVVVVVLQVFFLPFLLTVSSCLLRDHPAEVQFLGHGIVFLAQACQALFLLFIILVDLLIEGIDSPEVDAHTTAPAPLLGTRKQAAVLVRSTEGLDLGLVLSFLCKLFVAFPRVVLVHLERGTYAMPKYPVDLGDSRHLLLAVVAMGCS